MLFQIFNFLLINFTSNALNFFDRSNALINSSFLLQQADDLVSKFLWYFKL